MICTPEELRTRDPLIYELLSDPNLHLPQKTPDNTYCPRPKSTQESCIVFETDGNEGEFRITLNFENHPDFDYGLQWIPLDGTWSRCFEAGDLTSFTMQARVSILILETDFFTLNF